MKNVVVTGTNGFIGGNLVAKLRKEYNVFEITEEIFKSNDWLKTLAEELDRIKPEAIFHVGAISNTLETDVNCIMIRNFEFTKRLADYCDVFQVPFIYSSSAACYGVNGRHPANLYGWSKYAAEQYILSLGGVALRYFNVYGPGEEDKGKMASVAYQMWENHNGGKPIKLFPGKPQRDFVYIDDVVNANIHALKNFEELQFRYYEVGSGEARTFEDVLDIMEISYTYADEKEIPKGYQLFTQSASTNWMPNWQPEYKLEDGLKKYKDYLILSLGTSPDISGLVDE